MRTEKGETLLLYTDRKQRLFEDMLKADEPCELPDKMRGYLLIKHANLNTNAHETMTRWTENALDWQTVFDNLRKLERPVPISGCTVRVFEYICTQYTVDPWPNGSLLLERHSNVPVLAILGRFSVLFRAASAPICSPGGALCTDMTAQLVRVRE